MLSKKIGYRISEFMFCPIEFGVDDCLPKELPQSFNQVQIRRIRRKEDLLDFRAFHPFSELFTQVITRIIRGNVDSFSIGVLLQSRLVKRDGGIGIDARTLLEYDVCHIMRIEESVDVDTISTAHRRLIQTFALPDRDA